MKKPSRFLRLVGVAGLLATLLAGVFATPMAYAGAPNPDPSDDGEIGDIWDNTIEPFLQRGPGGIFFPWVGNDDESAGLGPADTSVSVMNISADPAVVFAYVGSHDTDELPETGGWDVVGPFFLAPWASKTFTAAQLGIAEGAGAPVAFSGFNELFTSGEVEVCNTVLGGALVAGNDVNGNGECTDVEVLISGDDVGEPYICAVDDANGDPADTVGGDGLNADGDCVDAEGGILIEGGEEHIVPTVLGGVAKQAVDGETLPFTTAADTSVSGYNSISGMELWEFDDWYFSIAQTNCGPGGCWNTILRIANYGNDVDGVIGQIGSAAVTARFFPADDAQGSLDTGFQLQALVNTGDVWEIDISDYVPEGWVGSVHVYSDGNIFAMADRVKSGYGMWLTNTASNAPYTYDYNTPGDLGEYVLYAPDVRLDYFGWNTGINVANLVNDDNNVNIQYFNLFGNAPTTLTRRLAAQGMTYFYDPSQPPQDNSLQDPTQDLNADIIGSALIFSEHPVAVSVDATKYPESTTSEDPQIFQGTTYSATGNVYTTQVHPLVQKGNPTTGMGATSGVNIMNPNATAAQATVWWVNPSGFGADNYGHSAVAIPGFANGYVYTLASGNLPNGFYGSAVVYSTLPVASVTSQVDYQVEWDGTATWLGYNPCGFYRDNGSDDSSELTGGVGNGLPYDVNCNLGDPFNTSGGQVTKLFHDDLGNDITGVYAELWNEAYYQQYYLENESFPGVPWEAGGFSNVDGEIEWTNVPEGTYYLYIGEVPEGNFDYMYDGVGTVEGPFTLNTGEDMVLENELDRILATKIVYLGDDAEGVEVCLHYDANGDGDLDTEEEENPVDCEQADGSELGEAVFENLEPGWYWISVNAGYQFPVVVGFNAQLFGPEFFGLGGLYINDLTNAVNPAEGSIQKVLTLPEFLVALGPDFVEISGIISIYGPDGTLEAEGNVQDLFVDPIGPNDEDSFYIFDANVPVGGDYTIDETIVITYDPDGPGPSGPVQVGFSATLNTAVDGQVICDDYLDPSSTCEASPDHPDIHVYENQVTRVFNDLTGIQAGLMDVFIRDDELDQPIEDGLVCLFDEDNQPYTGSILTSCDLTDADGQAQFPDVPSGIYTITAAAADHEVDSALVAYFVEIDGLVGNSGGPYDDELGDELFGLNLDFELALDPQASTLDVLVAVDDNANAVADGPPADEGVNGILTLVYLTDPFGGDIAGPGGQCVSGTLIAAGVSANMLADGELRDGMTEFGVDFNDSFCVIADPNGDGIPTAATNVTIPQFDPDDDIDVTILEGPLGVIDIHVVIDGLGGQNGYPVFLFLDDPGDSSGVGGVCGGAPVLTIPLPLLTAPEPVAGVGVTNGMASYQVDTSQTYCALTIDPLVGPVTVHDVDLDPVDQDDDIDGEILIPLV